MKTASKTSRKATSSKTKGEWYDYGASIAASEPIEITQEEFLRIVVDAARQLVNKRDCEKPSELQRGVAPTPRCVESPPQCQPGPSVTSANFTDNVFDVNRQLEIAMNDVEDLVYRFCGAFPVPSLDNDPPEQGIVLTVIWAMNKQRAMIDRIRTAVDKLRNML